MSFKIYKIASKVDDTISKGRYEIKVNEKQVEKCVFVCWL